MTERGITRDDLLRIWSGTPAFMRMGFGHFLTDERDGVKLYTRPDVVDEMRWQFVAKDGSLVWDFAGYGRGQARTQGGSIEEFLAEHYPAFEPVPAM